MDTYRGYQNTKELDHIYLKLIEGFHSDFHKLIMDETYIAGGAVRDLYNGKEISDYDIYFRSEESARKFLEILTQKSYNGLNYTDISKLKLNKTMLYNSVIIDFIIATENAISFKTDDGFKIQFIYKWIGEPKDVISKFDFYNCHCFYDPKEINYIHLTHDFIQNSDRLKLNPNKDCNNLHSLKRAFKLTKKGYKMYNKDILELVDLIANNSTQEDRENFLNKYDYI